MKHVHIVAHTPNHNCILAGFKAFPLTRLYYFLEDTPYDGTFKPTIDTPHQILSKVVSDEDNYQGLLGRDFPSIYFNLKRTVEDELKEGNKVYINISTGTRIFTSAATLIGNQLQVELYYVAPNLDQIEKAYSGGRDRVEILSPLARPLKIFPVESDLCFVAMLLMIH
jgi:hypothetical protein